MGGSNKKIDLVYHSVSPSLRQLNLCLQEMNCAVEMKRMQDNADLSVNLDSLNPTIVFIDGPALIAVPPCLKTHYALPVLAVVSHRPLVDALDDYQDFLLWPCLQEELRMRVARLLRTRRSEPAVRSESVFAHSTLIGRSPAFTACLLMIEKLARWSVPVLIQGETGTGKELAARALHYLGPRRGKPFIPMNCGAVPDALFANELFGHERGAYTDASTIQKGLIAQAEGGTLFLDEVDCLSPANQVTLLRFLQDRSYRPLGAAKVMAANVTVIAATNTDLRQRVRENAFRQDLLYRLNVTELIMPSLRQRQGDIALLARHFLTQFSTRYGQPPKTLAPESLHWLECQSWPGNIRELENLIHRELLLAEGPVIRIDPADYEHQQGPEAMAKDSFSFDEGFNQLRERFVADFERRYLDQLMQATRGNVSEAARLAGKERRHLGRLLQKYGIKRENYLL